jgi:hypothetical protein
MDWWGRHCVLASIISHSFVWVCTFALYRNNSTEQEIELEEICGGIVGFGKSLAGQQDDLLLSFIQLIRNPGIHFWSFQTASSRNAMKQGYESSPMKGPRETL